MTAIPIIDYCDHEVAVASSPFTIGRDADLIVDDNPYLHRRFLILERRDDIWLLSNDGARLTATASDGAGHLDAFLGPGAVLPLVNRRTVVRFTAGPTSYEFSIVLPDALAPSDSFGSGTAFAVDDSDATIGRPALTPDQLRLVVALAEPTLRDGRRNTTVLPSSSDAADRLGWTVTKFNRKLDKVCERLADEGVRGLHGDPGRLASNRRARLVEYALATRLVTASDVDLIGGAPCS